MNPHLKQFANVRRPLIQPAAKAMMSDPDTAKVLVMLNGLLQRDVEFTKSLMLETLASTLNLDVGFSLPEASVERDTWDENRQRVKIRGIGLVNAVLHALGITNITAELDGTGNIVRFVEISATTKSLQLKYSAGQARDSAGRFADGGGGGSSGGGSSGGGGDTVMGPRGSTQQSRKWAKSLSTSEKEAVGAVLGSPLNIRAYQESQLGQSSLDSSKEVLRKHGAAFESAVKKAPTFQGEVVVSGGYRKAFSTSGDAEYPNEIADHQPGKTLSFQVDAFGRSTAAGYSGSSNKVDPVKTSMKRDASEGGTVHVVYKVKTKSGKDLSGHTQGTVLIPKNKSFKVVKNEMSGRNPRTKRPDMMTVHLEEL